MEKLDLKVKVLRLEGAKDPDDFIKLKGPEAFRNLLEGSENQIDYRMRSVKDKYDLSVDEQKVEYLKEATELVARLPGAVERQVYAMRLASTTGLSSDVVAAEVERRRKKLVNRAGKAEEREQSRPEKQNQPNEKEFRYENLSSATAEEGIIRLLYLEPELGKSEELPEAEEFSSQVLGRIYSALRSKISQGASINTACLGQELSQNEMSLLVSILQKPEILANSRRTLRDYIEKMREQSGAKSDDLLQVLASRQKKEKDLRDKYGR